MGTPCEVLPAVEIVPKKGAMTTSPPYGRSHRLLLTGRLDDGVATACRDTALEAWAALGLRDVTRVDMIVDGAGEPESLRSTSPPD